MTLEVLFLGDTDGKAIAAPVDVAPCQPREFRGDSQTAKASQHESEPPVVIRKCLEDASDHILSNEVLAASVPLSSGWNPLKWIAGNELAILGVLKKLPGSFDLPGYSGRRVSPDKPLAVVLGVPAVNLCYKSVRPEVLKQKPSCGQIVPSRIGLQVRAAGNVPVDQLHQLLACRSRHRFPRLHESYLHQFYVEVIMDRREPCCGCWVDGRRMNRRYLESCNSDPCFVGDLLAHPSEPDRSARTLATADLYAVGDCDRAIDSLTRVTDK